MAVQKLIAVVVLLVSSTLSATAVELTPLQQVGKMIFFDTNLSAVRNQSCATCHAPEVGWSGPDSTLNSLGGVYNGSFSDRFGNRRPPSAAYVAQSPVLRWDKKEKVFIGGAFWDGRATGKRLKSTAAEQAQGPFLNPVEHGFADAVCVVSRVCNASYASELQKIYPGICAVSWPAEIDKLCSSDGYKAVMTDTEHVKVGKAYDAIAHAIAAFELSPEVNPFSSKFDAWQAGKAKLSKQEQLGLKLFNGKGKCSQCHPSSGRKPLFTDFTYDNIGVPRNPHNQFYSQKVYNPEGQAWVDPGLGGFLAGEKAWQKQARVEYGKHKVPTLRNVDKRTSPDFVKAFGHNGYFKSLKEVVHFYNTRDSLPVCKPGDKGEKVSCWPLPETAMNMNMVEMGNLGLTDAEEEAIVVFMKTLSDGYRVK
ncbi:cytochrome C [Trichlorobacter lovleyi]|uniref:cytochrome-c peroxidase n=1 Tax=Trichlorobacter lovleyi TaxID=313985 RepID=UPI00223F9404|nr:cytochrome c peroxidase [Trichlorobacter lovleyi]QOX78821.1 cytochrome C [Trichlorobacter lovleyi]